MDLTGGNASNQQEFVMAKMFYTLEEAAEKLGLSEQHVKELASSGQLQQFRDRDKLMFKREQVDNMAAGNETAAGGSSGPIPLSDSTGGTDAIDLKADDTKGGQSGISVFETGEVEHADPLAKTQLTEPIVDDEELALDNVGSGSGLLDLTRESDDTSLGAELLDEIYPAGGSGGGGGGAAGPSDSKLGSSVAASGIFDGAMAMESGQATPIDLDNLAGETSQQVTGVSEPMSMAVIEEEIDPSASGFNSGILIGSFITLIIGLTVAVASLMGTKSPITSLLTEMPMGQSPSLNLMIWCAVLLVASIVFGVIGSFMGKAAMR